MKNCLLIVALTIFVFAACSKQDAENDELKYTKNLPADDGCIEKVYIPVTAHSISDEEVATVNNLFLSSGLPVDQYRYSSYKEDSFQTYYEPYAIKDSKSVQFDYYTNGLRIFYAAGIAVFTNDSMVYKNINNKISTKLNATPSLTLPQLRKLFITDCERFDHAGDFYKDSCLTAEFGYLNINGGTGNEEVELIKAWKVTPKYGINGSQLPVAYYQDKDGKTFSYDNGTRYFSLP